MERLDKLLAGTGKWSRREVKALVRQGLVRVDGRLAASAEDKLDPAAAIITVAGETISLRRFTYVMLHKPAGVLTATEDRKQPTVLDLLPPELRRIGLAPVGRLDKDTEGLLLLTNDGELAHRLLSPKYHVEKRYFARVDGELSAADAEAFARGMTLGDGLECLPAGLEVLPDRVCIVTLREGKFHQVKRMLAARGAPVLYLKRLSMGPLTLDDSLAAGAYRLLRAEEILALYRACGL
ncbi:pseudouridine synthase [Evtepia gabavorous]|uniref:pseudouridine synthase n=1 Tax=Evtepia gabavorous TaxID=2211183 RepID=UPI003A8C9271